MKGIVYKIFGLSGFLLLISSLIFASFYKFPYFYSIFLIGWLLLIEYIAHKVKIKPIINNKKPSFFIYLLLAYSLLHLITEIYGRLIANMWYYPHYTSTIFYINLQIIIYGLGSIACMETYRVSKNYFSKKIKGNFFKLRLNSKILEDLRKVFFYLSIIFLLIPLVSFFFFDNWKINYFFLFPLLAIWLFFDSINKNNPLIKDLLEGKKSFLINLILIPLLIGLLHEFPNTFVWEWVYQNIPITNFGFNGLPIIVLLGWIPMIMWGVAVLSFVESKLKI